MTKLGAAHACALKAEGHAETHRVALRVESTVCLCVCVGVQLRYQRKCSGHIYSSAAPNFSHLQQSLSSRRCDAPLANKSPAFHLVLVTDTYVNAMQGQRTEGPKRPNKPPQKCHNLHHKLHLHTSNKIHTRRRKRDKDLIPSLPSSPSSPGLQKRTNERKKEQEERQKCVAGACVTLDQGRLHSWLV